MIGNRSFWSKLKAQPTVGVVLQSASPLVANSMSAAGFDWLVIDPINSPLSQLESFAMQTAVGDGNATPVFMRVGGPTDRSGIQQATDTGAAGILVPNVRSAEDISKARRPTRFPPIGDRSLYGPLRAHHKEGVVVHMLQSDRNFVVAVQLERAPIESWEHLLAEDFHIAVLDVPQLCVELGLYDTLLAAPPDGDGTLATRLAPWLQVYQHPCAELAGLVTRFGELCAKHGKVAGVLLGEHSAAPLYQSLGMQFIGIGSDLMVMMEPATAAIERQRVNTSHDWGPAPVNCATDKTRSDAFWDLLRRNAPFAGAILTDCGYETMRAVRPAPVVLIDCFREGLNTPAALSRALRLLDGTGHRLVRTISADPKDTPMTATVALALGADSVVVPVRNAAEARAVKAACSYKGGSRALNIGPELPYHMAKVPAAGIELLSVPPVELAEMIAAADFVVASTANFFLSEGRERGLASIVSLQEACKSQGKPFFLLDDASPPVETPEDSLLGFDQRLSLPPDPVGEDAHIAAQNARLADFKRGLRGGAKSIGQVVCAASPTVAAAYIAAGVDWVWIEWQHACQDATALRAQVAAIAQRGGLSVVRTAGAHDKAGIQQCLDAGVDMVLVPYINTVEEAKQSVRHCLFAPQGDRVWNGSALSREKKSAVMFQLETSACMDALKEICREPAMEFGIVGPGDLAVSLGLMTRDSMFGYMKADEVKWCYTHIVETCTEAGKIAGGFTRGGDPSSLLSHGFAMVGLSHDLLDASVGAQSIMTGGMAFGGAFQKTAPGLTQLKKWPRNRSKLVPTAGYVCSTVIPTVIWHLWSVKGWGAAPHLALPKVMPADVSGTVDMEKVEPGPNPTPYWIAMAEGVARMLFPTAFTRIEARIGLNAGVVVAAAVVVLLLGAALIAFWP
jgi:2-keto-3-deoxy-L-rhamnonate aldolase RhmA